MVLSEAIYGWYPPAKSRWTKPTKPGQPVGYEEECLYRHYDSRFNGDKRGVATPETPSVICIDLNPPGHSKQGSRDGSQSRSSTRSQSRGSKLSFRAASVKVPKFYSTAQIGTPIMSPSPTGGHQLQQHKTPTPPSGRPKKAWVMQTEATPIVTPQPPTSKPHPQASPKIYSANGYGQARPVQQHIISTSATPYGAVTPAESPAPVVTSPTGSEAGRVMEKKARIQSAPPQRSPSVKLKYRRPVKSAGPVRPDVTGDFHVKTKQILPRPTVVSTNRSQTSSPAEPCPRSTVRESPSPPEAGYVLDYDTQLKKHGWRMEIPGDPLGLKSPCFAPRLPITQKVPIPRVPPNPPTGHMEVYDTYFYNTIPRKPLSFTVHPEWVSEVLHAKRMALQKKEGVNFKHTNYSFAY